jgi:hypothetical protein
VAEALQNRIRKQIRRYLAGDLTAGQLESWLIDATHNIHRHPDTEARPISGRAQLLPAEYDRGHRDEASVRAELERLEPVMLAG